MRAKCCSIGTCHLGGFPNDIKFSYNDKFEMDVKMYSKASFTEDCDMRTEWKLLPHRHTEVCTFDIS